MAETEAQQGKPSASTASESSGHPIEFYFDFSSPNAYLAAEVIDELAQSRGRQALWRPFLLGAAFPKTGAKPPKMSEEAADRYLIHDVERSARLLRLSFTWPDSYPFSSLMAARLYYWLEAQQDEPLARDCAKALFRRAFVDGGDIGSAQKVVEVVYPLLAAKGYSAEAVAAGLVDESIKERLRRIGDDAASKGVFGVPFFIVDGEPFYGADRLGQIQHWLDCGGW